MVLADREEPTDLSAGLTGGLRWRMFAAATAIAVGVVAVTSPAAFGAKVSLVKDIRPGHRTSYAGNLGSILGVDGTLYFSADDGVHGLELWKSDGSRRGTRRVLDIYPGATGS